MASKRKSGNLNVVIHFFDCVLCTALTLTYSTQRASMDAGIKTLQCPHRSIHFCISST